MNESALAQEATRPVVPQQALCPVQKQYVPILSLASLTLSVFGLHGGRGELRIQD